MKKKIVYTPLILIFVFFTAQALIDLEAIFEYLISQAEGWTPVDIDKRILWIAALGGLSIVCLHSGLKTNLIFAAIFTQLATLATRCALGLEANLFFPITAVVLGLMTMALLGAAQSSFGGPDLPSQRLLGRCLGFGALLLAVATALASIPAAFRAAMAAVNASGQAVKGVFGLFKLIWQGICYLVILFWNWLMSFMHEYVEETPAHVDSAASGGGGMTLPGNLLAAVTIAAVLIFIALLVTFVAVMHSPKAKDGRTYVEADFTETTRRLRSQRKKRRRGLADRLRPRPKLSDYTDPRLQLRYALSRVLEQEAQSDPMALTKTPNELSDHDHRRFFQLYNDARYSQASLPEDSTKEAQQILKDRGLS